MIRRVTTVITLDLPIEDMNNIPGLSFDEIEDALFSKISFEPEDAILRSVINTLIETDED